MTIDTLARDLRLATRALARTPGFSLVVILTLALGIGATTAIFSVVDAVLLAPLPYTDGDRLVMVWQNDRYTGTLREASSVPDFFDFKERTQTLQDLAAYFERELSLLRQDGEPLQVSVAMVSHNLGPLLGTTPQLGRAILAEEDVPNGPQVALLADAFWTRAFGRDENVLGRTLNLDDTEYTVVGILPPGLGFPSRETDIWLPLYYNATTGRRENHFTPVIARLADGVTVAAAQDDMSAVAAQLEAEYPANRGRGAFVEPLAEVARSEARPALLVLFGAVLTVLLIACANVANLLLVRGAARGREIAVRSALGAGTAQLARRFLVESLLLTSLATVAGVTLAFQGLRVLLSLAPARLESLADVSLDLRVLLFSVVVSVAVAVGFALVPTLQSRRFDLVNSLKEGRGEAGGRPEKMRFRRFLVVAQMALALILLAGAGLLLMSFHELRRVDPGFNAENVLRLDFKLPSTRYPRDFSNWPRWAEVHDFHSALLPRVESLPGARSAAITSNHPLDAGFTNSFVIVGRETEARDQGELKTRLISHAYFQTAGVSLLEGRFFAESDGTEAAAVLLLNQAAVARYFPDRDAVGAKLAFWGSEREVIGVVANERMHGLAEATPPAMYAPISQVPPIGGVTLMVATSIPSSELIAPVRDTIWDLDRGLAVYNVTTMDETLADSLARERFTSLLLALFAAVAVVLAGLGVHGVLSYLVAQRRREVGVRMALGASRRQVLGLVVSQGMTLAAIGIVLGTAGALMASRLVAGLLYGISATDPKAYVTVAVLLGASALLACALPALRAARVDPAAALRSE